MKRKDWVNHQRNTKNTGGPDHCSVKIISQVFLRCRTARPHHRTKQFLPVQTRHPIGNGNSTIHAIQDTTLSWSKIQSSGREKREGVIHFSPSIFDNDQTRSSNSKTQHNFIIRNSISQIVP